MSPDKRVTELLIAFQGGDSAALGELMPLIYDELRAIASRKLRSERANHTLTPTSLVHEAYLKLVRLDGVPFQSRAHFLAVAAQAMRQVLVNHALRRKRAKRGGGAAHVSLEDMEGATRVPRDDGSDLPAGEADRILALHAALNKLAEVNPRHARIVEGRFFGGMTVEETATALEISPATVKRDWALLRAWLRHELDGARE